VKPADLLVLLGDVYRDKLALLGRHEAGARTVGQYDFNNTYQYIIAREEVQLSWLQDAIEGLGGTVAGAAEAPPVPRQGKGIEPSRAVLADDARLEQAFVERWREPIEGVTNARQKGILRVIVGEALEHKRFFEQAAAGRTDLLGRHMDGVETRGQVLKTRWVE
jgi:hypothetical protein